MAFYSAPVFLMAEFQALRSFVHRFLQEESPPLSARGGDRERVQDIGLGDDIFHITWETQAEGCPWATLFAVEGFPHGRDHDVIALQFSCHVLSDPLREYGDRVLQNAVTVFEEAAIPSRVVQALPPGPTTTKDEVERLRRAGRTNPDIAELLNVSVKTVANYVTDINHKLREDGQAPLPIIVIPFLFTFDHLMPFLPA